MILNYFSISEFECKYSGLNEMDEEFLNRLDRLRGLCGFPFVITSGFRSTMHPVESVKEKGGTHTQGIAADIAISNGLERYKIIKFALQLGFTGIGVAKNFVHVDTRKTTPVIWNY